MSKYLVIAMLFAATASAQTYQLDPVPADPGVTPRWVLLVGEWSRSPFCVYGSPCPSDPAWSIEYYEFQSKQAVGEWMSRNTYWSPRRHIIGLWELHPDRMIPVKTWRTERTVPREKIIEEHEEETFHYSIGDDEFEVEVDPVLSGTILLRLDE